MATMYCPKCSIENDSDSKFCKRCGYQFATKQMDLDDGQTLKNTTTTVQGSYRTIKKGMASTDNNQGYWMGGIPNSGTNNGREKRNYADTIAEFVRRNSVKSVVSVILAVISVLMIIAGKDSGLPMLGILLWLSAIIIGGKDLKDKKNRNDGKGHFLSVIAIALSIIILWTYVSENRNPREGRSSLVTERSYSMTSQETKQDDSTQELIDEWQKKSEELVNSFHEQVNVEQIQEQVKEQIQESVKEQLGEVLEPGEINETESVPEKTDNNSESVLEGVVTPSFKETMDSYEEFFDEYIAFMNKMMNGDAMTSMDYLNDYAAFMGKYEETMEALDKMDTDKMSPADQAYYFEVMTRIETKLLKVAGAY